MKSEISNNSVKNTKIMEEEQSWDFHLKTV